MKAKTKKPPGDYKARYQSDLLTFVRDQMKVYGDKTNLDRAVPDLHDGLKPVTRRLVWTLRTVAKDQPQKSARVIGACMGIYHPHGDASIQEALTNMVNSETPLVEGVGSWGDLVEKAGAPRYTNCVLSKFGDTFISRDYLAVTTMVDNYDRQDKEPLNLPSLLPNLFFNGAYGIGVGMSTSLPTFTPQSVLDVMISLLNREKLEPEDYANQLKFFSMYGARPVKSKANKQAFIDYLKNSSGKVRFMSDVTVDQNKKTILLDKFTPNVSYHKVKAAIKADPRVLHVADRKGLAYEVQVRSSINMKEFSELVTFVQNKMQANVRFDNRVTVRKADSKGAKEQTDFFRKSIPDLFKQWLKWRIDLEVRCLHYRIVQCQFDIDYHTLLVFASDHIDEIIKIIKTSKTPKDDLKKRFKWTELQADQILNLRLKQLSRLDQQELKDKIKDLKAKLAELNVKLKDPVKTVRLFLEQCKPHFKLHVDVNCPQKSFWIFDRRKSAKLSAGE